MSGVEPSSLASFLLVQALFCQHQGGDKGAPPLPSTTKIERDSMNAMLEKPAETAAERTEVELTLSPEQVRALCGHAKAISQGRIVLKMMSDNDVYGMVKVAAYSYSGSECCV